jgi:hypothetical protein
MIDPKQIPDEVVLALHDSLVEEGGAVVPACYCRAAIAAALDAWPQGNLHTPIPYAGAPRPSFTLPAIILPLPKDAADE